MHRRSFLKIGLGTAGSLMLPCLSCSKTATSDNSPELPFKLSLAQWSLNKGFFGRVEPKLDALDFAKIANSLGIEGLEYVNQFFMDKAQDQTYLAELKKRAEDYGCRSVLIMCDSEGNLGDPSDAGRTKAVENHVKWLEAAKYLGCHSIRVNARSEGSYEEQQKLAIDGLGRLCEKGAEYGLNVIVENHGYLSSNASLLAEVMKSIQMSNCGTLPDFGNFCLKREGGKQWDGECIEEYDRYKGVAEMMPYAKAVSAKSYDFDEAGNETKIDYAKMLRIVKKANYKGYIGVEYEGSRLSEKEGIELIKKRVENLANSDIF